MPRFGPVDVRDFSDEEQARVVTAIDFELPYSLDGVSGAYSWTVHPPSTGCDTTSSIEASILVRTRQRNPEDIRRSLGLVELTPPRSGVIVAVGDPLGRISVSEVQVQVPGFVPVPAFDEWFDAALSAVNRFIAAYRRVARDFSRRTLSAETILYWRASHILDGRAHNCVVHASEHLGLSQAPTYERSETVALAMQSAAAVLANHWQRLIWEARHYLAVGETAFGIITAFTALEAVLKRDRGDAFWQFVARRIPGAESRWRHRETRDSVSTCLSAVGLLHSLLGLPDALAERIWEHYHARNSVVHSGSRRLSAGKAEQCVDDVEQLIRFIEDAVHLSVTVKLHLRACPPRGALIELIRLDAPDLLCRLLCCDGRIEGRLSRPDGPEVHVSSGMPSLAWGAGCVSVVALTYNGWTGSTSLIVDAAVVATARGELGPVDASALVLAEPQAERATYLPVEFALTHGREVCAGELADIDSIFVGHGEP